MNSVKSPFRAIASMQGSGVHEQVNTVSGHRFMAKVLGIGGIFFKAKDPVVLRPEAMAAHPGAATVFSPFKADTKYFEPSTKDFMINFAVDDLDAILANCAKHGVEAKVMPEEPNGKFAHISDPEGTRIELWEPKPMA